MNIIINSLYSNREIFLRELISNASDAIEKIRFLAVTNPKILGEGDLANLDIRIRTNEKEKTVEIIDKGIGMSKDELIRNLGTIAKSGTSSFLEKISKDGDGKDLIGQFGVGFYSSYLVADSVTVISKSNDDDKQYAWVSSADKSFTVFEDKDGERLGRGTKIILHLKEDASEFLSVEKIKDLVRKYSQFISFPIFVETVDMVDEEIEEEPEEAKGDESSSEEEKTEEEEEETSEDEDEDEEIKVEEGDEEPKKEKKTKKVEKRSWVRMNEERPIWIRDPSEVTKQEYDDFFKHITKEYKPPRSHIHFKTEGGAEFRSILYIPDRPSQDFYQKQGPADNVKLYIRRVLVQDAFDQSLLPSYLSFIKGIVDSDDIPINVSREMLQASKILESIRKKLVRKALEMIRALMVEEVKGDEDEKDEDEKDGDEKTDEATDGEAEKKKPEKKDKKKIHPYIEFIKEFGNALKWGIVEDMDNRERLTKLVRYHSTKTDTEDPNDIIALDRYVERMKEGQKAIYYLSGETMKQVKDSPFLERLTEKDYEVLLFTDPLDEYVMQQLREFDGFKFMDISKENFKLSEDDEKDEKEKLEHLKKSFKEVTKYIKNQKKKDLSKVVLSTRLASAPCAIVSSEYGYSARMETIMRAQALTQKTQFFEMPKVLEINPTHPIVRKLATLIKEDPESEQAKATVDLLMDMALISSGYFVSDGKGFQKRLELILRRDLSIGEDEKSSWEPLFPDEEIEDEEATDQPTPRTTGIDMGGENIDIDMDKLEEAAKFVRSANPNPPVPKDEL